MAEPFNLQDIVNIIVKELSIEPERVTLDAHFQNDLNADSLDFTSITMALEEKYNIEVPEEKARTFEYVRDVVNYFQDNYKP